MSKIIQANAFSPLYFWSQRYNHFKQFIEIEFISKRNCLEKESSIFIIIFASLFFRDMVWRYSLNQSWIYYETQVDIEFAAILLAQRHGLHNLNHRIQYSGCTACVQVEANSQTKASCVCCNVSTKKFVGALLNRLQDKGNSFRLSIFLQIDSRQVLS